MKILELTNYSAGICGVFFRVKEEAQRLSKLGHEVKIFSSNLEKGTNIAVPGKDNIDGIEITRFPSKKLGGESFLSWNFEKETVKYSPDIIIAHSYRHLHTTKALKIAKKINAKIFLVTHAPFARSRSVIQSTVVILYDKLIGKQTINKFNKVIAITNWEKPYLEKLGLSKDKIAYIPNGIPEQFFTQKEQKKKSKEEGNKILFLGRISPIKSIETIIKAIPLINEKSINLEIVGPSEEDYLDNLKSLVKSLKLESKVTFSPAIYDIKEKISKIDSCSIFVLPSLTEGMPQSLIEAMARKKTVISSDNLASKDLITNNKNGFLFKTKDEKDLANKINQILISNKETLDNIKINAYESVKHFSWEFIIEKLDNLIKTN